MAWRRELDLLAELLTATCTNQFVLKATDIVLIFKRVEAELKTKDGVKRLLSHGVFLETLFSAASAGLMSVCKALGSGALLTPSESCCLMTFFEIIWVDLFKHGMQALLMPHAAVVLAKGAFAMPPKALETSEMLSLAQEIINRTGTYHWKCSQLHL